ncbi:MAG: MerR family transcriptional regulator [Clostridia bacterium]|nr:MerR family transcriptional regulator [Clostridia bacterium]
MEKHRAIPDGFMRVGELAKKAGITTRTLRYYDKEGLLTPSLESEGGYRLYSDKDLVKLMRILMMKQLGFPLSEIKKRIVAMDTTAEVIDVLTEHAANICKEIEHLTESLDALETLKAEIVQVDSVDFKKFAVILENIHMKNDRYWLVKYLDDDVLDMLKRRATEENDTEFAEAMNTFIVEAAKLQEGGVPPESKKGQDFAARFWKALMEFTDGDVAMMQKMAEQLEKSASDEKHDETMKKSRLFMASSLSIYFGCEEITSDFVEATRGFVAEAVQLHDDGVPPESVQGQDFAERFWKSLMELTGGDVNMVQKMNEQFEKNTSNEKQDEIMEKSRLFMASSLEIYFDRLEKGGSKND